MNTNNIDLGEIKSRDLGNMMSKKLVELGKEALQNASPGEEIDYGSLPSRALPEIGKQVVANQIKQEEKSMHETRRIEIQ